VAAAHNSTSQVTPFVIYGTGRMAQAISDLAPTRGELELTALIGPQAPDWETAVPWHQKLDDLTQPPGLLIDFTLPEGTRTAADWCRSNGVPLLSGVTGLPDDIRVALRETARRVPVLWSPNLSLGVNLLADLAGRAAAVVGPQTPVWIEDIHHQWKKDAPSGTALMLGAVIAEQRGGDAGAIEYSSVREGEIIGEHTVRFTLDGEMFELRHKAGDRSIYARGALDAGCWLIGQPAGFYAARDWLAGR